MILTCPQCATRYLLPAHMLAPGGRRVKCSACGEIWSQNPDEDELQGAEEERFEDIPESVRPLPEGSNLPVVNDEKEKPAKPGRGGLQGYGAAGLIGIGIFAALVWFREPVSARWTASRGFYAMTGFAEEKSPAVEDVSLESLKVEAVPDGTGEKLLISGVIVNAGAESRAVPMIEAEMGDPPERWIIKPPADHAGPHSELSFNAEYRMKNPGSGAVLNLRFLP